MNAEQIKQEQERVKRLLEGITEGEWFCYGDEDELRVGIVEDDITYILADDISSPQDAALMAESQRLARAYLAALDTIAAQQARLIEVMDEHFPEWNDDRDQQGFEECMWQSDSAHAAALPAICAIRAVLAQAGEG